MHHDEPPATVPLGEAAQSHVGSRLALYIGEMPLDPRIAARYAAVWRDELTPLRVARNTLRDERVQSALDQRLDALVSRAWEVEPGGPGARERRAADELRAQLQAIELARTARQLLHAVWYGYSVGECMWERDGARVRLAEIRVRSPDRFRWDPESRLLLRTERNAQGEPVEPGKFVVLTRPGEHDDLPHGPGLARWCYWPVAIKRLMLRSWSMANDRYASPTTVGRYRPGATDAEIHRLLQIIRDLSSSSGVALPEDQTLELLEAQRRTGTTGGDFSQLIDYLDHSITTTLLGQSSTTDQGPWRGTAEVQLSVRNEVIAADARMLAAALNASVARWLTQWNHPAAMAPRIAWDVSPPEDLDARATREETIARTTGLRPTAAHVERVYGGEWEATPGPTPAPDAGPMPEAALAGGDADAVRAAAADAAADWAPLMEPLVQPVLDATDAAGSLEGLRDAVDDPALYEAMDHEPAGRRLGRLGFGARLSGEAGLVDDDAPPDGDGPEAGA